MKRKGVTFSDRLKFGNILKIKRLENDVHFTEKSVNYFYL